MKPKYLIKPGFVDPVRRAGFVVSSTLAKFYGLQAGEYVVNDPTEPPSKYMGLLALEVRPNGDYNEYRRAVDIFSERMNACFYSAARAFENEPLSSDDICRLVSAEMLAEREKIIAEGWLPAGFDTTFAIGVRGKA